MMEADSYDRWRIVRLDAVDVPRPDGRGVDRLDAGEEIAVHYSADVTRRHLARLRADPAFARCRYEVRFVPAGSRGAGTVVHLDGEPVED